MQRISTNFLTNSPSHLRTRPLPIALLLVFSSLFFSKNFAQSGCPGCKIQLSPALAADTIFIEKVPDGEVGKAYDQDISFRLPKTTTPVASIDSTVPPGLTISKFEIAEVKNLPIGLKWEANQTVFDPASQTDGCIKICGTPTDADSFVVLVKLKVSVLFLVQDQFIPIRMTVRPKTSTTDGFAMSTVEGCGQVTVNFSNNLPSGGKTGFTYKWDFGDSTTFVGENPPPHTFSGTGIYPVKYHATIDTIGYILKSVEVLEVECVDQLGVGSPDLYMFIQNTGDTTVFHSGADVVNASLPYTWQVNLPLSEKNYKLQVWDEDSGLKGGDDQCGIVSFNYLSDDTIVSGGFRAVLRIARPISEVISFDTVRVFPVPPTPFISTPAGLVECVGQDSLVLVSSNGSGNQWFKDGVKLIGETDFLLEPKVSGSYAVQAKNSFGCTSISAPAKITIHPLPALPVFWNNKNRQTVSDTTLLPDKYALQWFMFDAPIAGATGLTYCVTETGTYGLQVTDLATGCKSLFKQPVVFDPNFDCTVGTNDLKINELKIFPNPADERATVFFEDYILPTSGGSGGSAELRIVDFSGKILRQQNIAAGSQSAEILCSDLPAGVFVVEVFSGKNLRFVGRLVIVR